MDVEDRSLWLLMYEPGQYGVPKGNKAAPGNELGIFESLNDHYSKEDLDVYWSTLYP